MFSFKYLMDRLGFSSSLTLHGVIWMQSYGNLFTHAEMTILEQIKKIIRLITAKVPDVKEKRDHVSRAHESQFWIFCFFF